MILSDVQLAALAAAAKIPPERINPASIDLAIGHEIKVSSWQSSKNDLRYVQKLRDRTRQETWPGFVPDELDALDLKETAEALARAMEPAVEVHDLSEYPHGYWLLPGEGALLHTEQTLQIPKDKTGIVMLKSSRSREFINQMSLGLYDPGFIGQGVIQISAPVIPVNLKHGQLMAQLVLLDTHPVAVPYGAPGRVSHYQHQRGAQGSVHQ